MFPGFMPHFEINPSETREIEEEEEEANEEDSTDQRSVSEFHRKIYLSL